MNRSWYSKTSDTSSPDNIHQVLAFGNFSDIKTLKKKLGEKALRALFIRYPKKVYSPQSLNFIKNFILKITGKIDDQKYLKSALRITG